MAPQRQHEVSMTISSSKRRLKPPGGRAATCVLCGAVLYCCVALVCGFSLAPSRHPSGAIRASGVPLLREWGGQRTAVLLGAVDQQEAVQRGRRQHGLHMLWSGGRRTNRDEVTVNIERPSLNSRRISGSIIIDRPIEDVWLVLTDYNKLSDYVPNLTQSRQIAHPAGGIRLFQEGAQKIVGFDFRASLVMDMEEHYGDPDDRLANRKIKFTLAESAMFADFSGEWRLQFNSRMVNKSARPGEDMYTYSTKVFYMVYIKPKGVVPVVALEWQISEEVPNNLAAIKRTTESKPPDFFQQRTAAMAQRTLRSGVVISGYSKDSAAKAIGFIGAGATAPEAEAVPAPAATAAVARGGRGGGGEAAVQQRTAVQQQRVAAQQQSFGAQQQQQQQSLAAQQQQQGDGGPSAWEADETLEAYIQKITQSAE